MDNSTLRERLENKHSELRLEREKSWDPQWKVLRDNIDPDTGRFPGEEVNNGARKDQRIINNTATVSKGVLGAGMQSGMTSPARPWFELAAPDPQMNEYAPVKNWLWYSQNAMREVFIRSNLYNVLPSCYEEQGVFGTAVIAAIPDEKTLVRFYNFTIGSYYLATSNRALVDTLYREFSMTARQMAQ
ncbi:MAG: phage tail protein, partial [Pseudomonas sp.]|nr:phage tail protein [Pseudomonas sp.]